MISRLSSWFPPRRACELARGQTIPSTPLAFLTKVPLHPYSSKKEDTIKAEITKSVKKVKRRDYRDAGIYHRARQRLEANLTRQEELKKQRAEALGDPIRGITTPFVKSFDTATPLEITPSADTTPQETTASDPTQPLSPAGPPHDELLNHFVTRTELTNNLSHSLTLSTPIRSTQRTTADPAREDAEAAVHHRRHLRAQEAMTRIFSLSNANASERTRANIQRCISTFGRHNTDAVLKPKPSIPKPSDLPPTPRAGPDTGSSEVQIAILTAKIRRLADEFDGVSHNDKVNKRNLRLLLHRRQKLLKYLQRKERGGERWQNLIGTLGLTEGTWKGQIEVR
ncbi:hypothetical protein MMC12_007010 [Toensbergia leucococca]|nr:hypothetical protein [Toensbergia leucococca]